MGKPSDLIERHGWCQKAMQDSAGRICLLRAVLAGVDYDILPKTMDRLHKAVGTGLTTWNDAPGRTAAEVVEFLRGQGL